MKLEEFVSPGPIVLDSVIFGLQKAGGISRFWSDLIVGLDEHLTSRPIYALIPKNQNVEWEKIRGKLKNIHLIERKKFRWNKGNLFFESFSLRGVACRIEPSIWHTSYYTGFPLGFRGAKVASFYDMIHEKLGKSSSYDSRCKLATFKKSSAIVAISEHSRADLSAVWPPLADKTLVIPLCCSKEVGVERDLMVDESYFLFMGNRRWYKNFQSPVRAILQDRRFSDKKIIAIGGESPLNDEELALKREFCERIEFKGVVPYQEALSLTQGALCILYPTLYEGFGLPLLEAFASEIPILACRTSSIVEVAGEEYPLVEPNDIHSVSNVLERLLLEKERWGAYGKQRLEIFSKEKMINAFINLYSRLSSK